MKIVAALLGVALLAGCGVPDILNDARVAAANSGPLTAARHPACDHGQQLVRYLATGDNGGMPDLDQQYADQVGTLDAAQIRAKADEWITACDAKQDAAAALATAQAADQVEEAQQQAQQAQADAQAARDETAEAAQAAKTKALMNKQLSADCAAASGRFDATAQRCYSTVTGNPSGFVNEGCTGPNGGQSYLFPVDGHFIHPLSSFPGCWS